MASDIPIDKTGIVYGEIKEGRQPVAMTHIEPQDIHSGRIPTQITPLVPGQPAAPANNPATPNSPTPQQDGKKD